MCIFRRDGQQFPKLKVAKDVLNENVLAVTADSEIYSPVETESARKFAADIGVNHIVVKNK